MLKSVELYNYRNLSVKFTLDKCNLFIAPNGSGKSNLLEAIYFSNFARSFRPISNYAELIGPDEHFAKVEAIWETAPVTAIVSQTDKVERRFEEFGKRKMLNKFIGSRNVVLFAPNTLDLVAGEPSSRRTDLDDFLSTWNDGYAKTLEQYTLALKNRNAVIKMMLDGQNVEREFNHFTTMLVEKATAIYNIRTQFFAEIKPHVQEISNDLYKLVNGELDIQYQPNLNPEFDFATELAAKFADNRTKELVVGKTLYGVHKDDYVFLLDNAMLRYRGSRGQQRIASLVFKLAQFKLLQFSNEKEGIFLIDDLMSELDDKHRRNCADYLLASDLPFILTGAEQSDIPAVLIDQSNPLSK